jgi:hypothetical protein
MKNMSFFTEKRAYKALGAGDITHLWLTHLKNSSVFRIGGIGLWLTQGMIGEFT